MISQQTALFIGNLYGMEFGRSFHSLARNIQKNTQLSEFLYANGFPDSWRKELSLYITFSEIKELVLAIHSGEFLKTIQSRHRDYSLSEKDIDSILTQFSQLILNRCKDYDNDKYKKVIYALSLSLRIEDGLFYYESELLTKTELMDKHEVFYDSQTNSFISKKDMKIPTVEDVLLKFPLYERLDLDKDSFEHLTKQLHSFKTIDAYCIDCASQSTFTYFGMNSPFKTGNFVGLSCSRNHEHKIVFYFIFGDTSITKIGQYPSIADLSAYDVKKYRKILGDKHAEFTKAIGLASHGVGVGSFVYLRRIFEGLITKAYEMAIQDAAWKTANESSFPDKRIAEKILLLKDYLPAFLVENRTLYGIISKGIHELTEKECLEYFPIVKAGIELILDDEIERISKMEKISSTKKAIDAIKNKLSS